LQHIRFNREQKQILQKQMSATITTPANGSKLLEAVNFNRHLFASIIAQRDDWEELLGDIPAPECCRGCAGNPGGARAGSRLRARYLPGKSVTPFFFQCRGIMRSEKVYRKKERELKQREKLL
jgi:hypothetical protein